MSFLIQEAVLDALEEKKKIKEVYIYGKKRKIITVKSEEFIRKSLKYPKGRPYFRYLEDLRAHDDLMTREDILLKRVFNILIDLLKTETKREYKNFLSGLKRNVSLYYDRAEAKGFRDLTEELTERRVKEYPDHYILSGIPSEFLERKKLRFYHRLSKFR